MRFGIVLSKLKKYYRHPNAGAHKIKGMYKLLISTIIAQRNTDVNTAKVSEVLFSNYKNARQISEAPLKDLKKILKPSGFYNNKAKFIKESSRIIIEKHGGKVPKSMAELTALPGVGRKTAGIVLTYGLHKIEGIPVDTHVHRISNRLKWVSTKSPLQTEKELMEIVPKKYWLDINWLFVTHGKEICKALKPKCSICPIKGYCRYYKETH